MQLVLRIIQDVLDGNLRSGDRIAGAVATDDVHTEYEVLRKHVLEEGEEVRYVIHGGRVEDQIGTLHSRRVCGFLTPNVPAYVNVEITYIFFVRDFRDLMISTNTTKSYSLLKKINGKLH